MARIRADAGVTNGSFFHFFPSKEALGAELYVASLESYHDEMLSALAETDNAAEAVRAMTAAHLGWVKHNPSAARFLFEQAQADWLAPVRLRQDKTNAEFRQALSRWAEQVETAASIDLLVAQLLGPAQLVCRRWLSGKDQGADLMTHAPVLAEWTIRALSLA